MNTHYKSEKEPIELLLGMGGAVQYLEHTLKDESNYSVLVKTKLGNRQITIPIEAVQSIQSKKPSAEVIDSIRKQLISDNGAPTVPTTGTTRPAFHFWHWLLNRLGIRA
ncbi:hypothetical protein GO730_06500 [Spirosoma sp. HMF3257]|uniref:Uncharacterized protein n=1 Tax=Spirosoma telluris TaxID=2183553 RepID=A0A327NFJ7_9BACT|nr:hypothetical protein [Spirosoma telluris]RAI74081.1 hypothetical protein HMF3257_06445 [Spirosoma telluris]